MLSIYLKGVADLVSKNNNENFKSEGNNSKSNTAFTIIGFIIMLIAILFAVVPAILIARHCNPENKVTYGFLAFLFSDLYIFQWAIRKFVMLEPNYCQML